MKNDLPELNIFWFRRDLRLDDNCGLYHALKQGRSVLPLFIFDRSILDKLPNPEDRRLVFIHRALEQLQSQLLKIGSSLLTQYGEPLSIWRSLLENYSVKAVYTNQDYEPYARKRDHEIGELLTASGVQFFTCKDQVIFEKNEITKDDGRPYTVFTPYKNKWRNTVNEFYLKSYPTEKYHDRFLHQVEIPLIRLEEMGFKKISFDFPIERVDEYRLKNYSDQRDIPSLDATSRLSIHLRFGTISIRRLVKQAFPLSDHWVNELIWREFYQQILWHFPHVTQKAFRKEYDRVDWRTDETDFKAWCEGKTGYPLVDAGMRELNATGFMHNRVRMVTASFLTRHLFLDWRWGEAYFAQHLLDFEQASNNGGWQWAAGTGTDAAPYFRIFNPTTQQERFDPRFIYVKKWIPEWGTPAYPKPIVEHVFARNRCLESYKKALGR